MLVGTFKLSRSLQIIFSLLVILFFLLAIGDFTGNKDLKTFAGYEGIICGLSALYTCIAQILNEVYKKRVLPV
jgi:succinate-acetate transporter protein